MNMRVSLLVAVVFIASAVIGCGENATSNSPAAVVGDPTQPGPYGVGVQRIAFTKPSVTMPDQQRVLLTEI
jgi:hypothetical protein